MNITRARDYRLYFGSPKARMLDMALDGGRALFGHSPKGLAVQYKNEISKGLHSALPTKLHGMAIRLLKRRFPDYRPILFSNREQLMFAFNRAYNTKLLASVFHKFTIPENDLPDSSSSPKWQLWRPFSNSEPTEDVCVPILPQPGYVAPAVLLIKANLAYPQELQPEEGVSAVFLAGLVQVLRLLLQAEEHRCFGSTAILEHQPAKHRAALGKSRHWFDQQQWGRWDAALPSSAKRVGPYVFSTRENIDRESLVKQARQLGLVLPEIDNSVIILPSMCSDREEKLIRELFSSGEWDE